MPGQTDRIMGDLNGFIEREVRGLTVDITEHLAAASPRDTGWLASSWRASIGGPTREPLRPAGNPGQGRSALVKSLAVVEGAYRLEFGPVVISSIAGYATEADRREPFVDDAIDRVIAARQSASPVRARRRRR